MGEGEGDAGDVLVELGLVLRWLRASSKRRAMQAGRIVSSLSSSSISLISS